MLIAAAHSAATTQDFANTRWVLQSRPAGRFRASNLKLERRDEAVDTLDKDEVLVAVETLSIEAFYRTTLDAEAYHGSTPLGGGVVAFPVSVLVLKLTPKEGRDFACLIQSVSSRPGAVCACEPMIRGLPPPSSTPAPAR